MKHDEHARPLILLVDDDPELRALLAHRLRHDHLELHEAGDVKTAKQKLYEADYDLIILDLMMAPESGYVMFEFLKQEPKFMWVPLIVLSGKDDLDDKVRCLELGADDYVTKPFELRELKARVNRLIHRTRDYESLAFRDSLTGIFNRRYFEMQYTMELNRMERYEQPLALALIDIDRFKMINDRYGHPIGDQVLMQMSDALRERLRKTDLLARFGGEEFVILFVNTEVEQAMAILESMRLSVQERVMATAQGERIRITFSAGVSGWRSGREGREWLNYTDQLLYKAKQNGRNRIESESC
ncbi:diguanylate cyclase [Paenibacillus sp. YYML68]|uniref:diguanylate cyclase n=1 Tax=Paenibacillus sp. YYML68 TaxID=2909250 RepID=UPI00248F508F|nr:diguanylate cyclase [Paenibacillus sp. YYML68]